MKEITNIIPFFINPDNMQYLLKGKIIENFDEIHTNLIKNIKQTNGILPIYNSREKESIHKSEYADIEDEIIGKIVRYIKDENGHNALEVEIINSLVFCKINNPVIKINGYCYETEDGNIHISEITRLTIGSMND